MIIRCGYDIAFALDLPTTFTLLLSLRPELDSRLLQPEKLRLRPIVPCEPYVDMFGNRGLRIHAPAGLFEITSDLVVYDGGEPSPIMSGAHEHPVAELPVEVLPYLLSSRYCEVDLLGKIAWDHFGGLAPGWNRIQAISDWVNGWLRFDYAQADATRTANQAYGQRVGVCRDFTHLAITLCRSLNIPARYVTGYLGDIGVPPDPNPMDFSACMEVYLGGTWHLFDVRHNERRIGFLPLAHGRDAADVAFATSYGPHRLEKFVVVTHEERAQRNAAGG